LECSSHKLLKQQQQVYQWLTTLMAEQKVWMLHQNILTLKQGQKPWWQEEGSL
jgi:hypothetical protein